MSLESDVEWAALRARLVDRLALFQGVEASLQVGAYFVPLAMLGLALEDNSRALRDLVEHVSGGDVGDMREGDELVAGFVARNALGPAASALEGALGDHVAQLQLALAQRNSELEDERRTSARLREELEHLRAELGHANNRAALLNEHLAAVGAR